MAHEHDHGHHQVHHHDDHEHEHRPISETGIEITAHEGAWIGTVRCRIPGDYEDAVTILRERMEREAEEFEASGGLIGHLKAYAREEGRQCMLSITECGDIQRKETVNASVYVEHAAIIFGMNQGRVQEILEKQFQEYI